MRYRAVAIASERSNAVGTVELECTPHGIFVAYLGVGAFSEGYAPAALTSGTGLTVPWQSVTEARVEGDQVLLAFDHRLTPLNRLLLMHFATGRALPAEELARRRLIVRVAAGAAALAAALIVTASVLRASPETGAGAAILVAALAAMVLLGAGFLVDRNLAAASDEPATLAAFAMELSHFLPELIRLPRRPEALAPLPDISDLQGLLPRTTLAIVITLTAGALGVLLVARWVTTNESAVARVTARMLEAPEPSKVQATAPADPAPAAAPRPAAPKPSVAAATGALDPVVLGADCRCARADSLLWAEPIPRLSLLVLNRRIRQGRGADENSRKKYLELDLAVVNNGADPIDEVALLVLFYEPDPEPSDKRTQVDNRPLFFEGPLLPAQAIKWSVEAEGTEYSIENPIRGDIGPSGEYGAPTNRLAELLQARNRAVRLHGSMLLAFHGDPRAKEAVLELREALREDEAPYLTRLIQALGDTRVCQVMVAGEGATRTVSGCVHNTSKEPKRDLGIRLRGLSGGLSTASPTDEPPTVLLEATLGVPGELPPGIGRAFRGTIALGDQHAPIYEAFADQRHLLP